MAAPIDFYFDFSSPYGYIATSMIDDLGKRHGRDVLWHPILLGAVFKVSSSQPLTSLPPIKANYFRHDFARTAKFHGVPFKMPAVFPFMAVAASRAFYWLTDRDPARAKRLAKVIFFAAFGEGRDVSAAETVAEIATTIGLDRAEVLAGVNDPAVKERLRSEVDHAIKIGVFGSPFVIVDGEPFWGSDRFDQVERWLAEGGW